MSCFWLQCLRYLPQSFEDYPSLAFAMHRRFNQILVVLRIFRALNPAAVKGMSCFPPPALRPVDSDWLCNTRPGTAYRVRLVTIGVFHIRNKKPSFWKHIAIPEQSAVSASIDEL